MTITELIGTYTIEGKNQDAEATAYKGILELKKDENRKIIAEWTIGNSQKQFGTGFFKNNILVINFNYTGDDLIIYKGTVVYHFLTKDILDGFWSEKHGNQQYLGEERGFRMK